MYVTDRTSDAPGSANVNGELALASVRYLTLFKEAIHTNNDSKAHTGLFDSKGSVLKIMMLVSTLIKSRYYISHSRKPSLQVDSQK